MSDAPAIKPCPFCGMADIIVKGGSTYHWLLAECQDCGAMAGEVRVQTSGKGSHDEWMAVGTAAALEEWNRRA